MKFTIEKSVIASLVQDHVSALITINPNASLDISFSEEGVTVAIVTASDVVPTAENIIPANTVTSAPADPAEAEEKPKRKYTRRTVEVAEKAPEPESEPTPADEGQAELPFEPDGEPVSVEEEAPVGEELAPEYQEDKTPAVVEEAPPSAPKRGLFSGLKKPVNN